jgi:hypothetical protein
MASNSRGTEGMVESLTLVLKKSNLVNSSSCAVTKEIPKLKVLLVTLKKRT